MRGAHHGAPVAPTGSVMACCPPRAVTAVPSLWLWVGWRNYSFFSGLNDYCWFEGSLTSD